MVHRLDNLSDLTESVDRKMHSPIHHFEDPFELKEVLAFRRTKWICFEERNDHFPKIVPPIDLIAHQILAMIVVPAVAIYLAAPKEVPNQLEDVSAALTLNNRKDRLHLPAAAHPSIS